MLPPSDMMAEGPITQVFQLEQAFLLSPEADVQALKGEP
jgi:hypothetical protein